MTSRWFLLTLVGTVMSISVVYAGSLKQFEDYAIDGVLGDDDYADDSLNDDVTAVLQEADQGAPGRSGETLADDSLAQYDDALNNEVMAAIEEAKKEVYAMYENMVRKPPGSLNLHYGGALSGELKDEGMQEAILLAAQEKLLAKGYSSKRVYGIVLSPEALESIGCGDKKVPRCDENARFRTIDGKCNNLRKPLRGAANHPFSRLVEPDYADGSGKPRRAKDGTALPNARRVSVGVSTDTDVPSRLVSHLGMGLGQFLDHDITLGAHSDEDCSGVCNKPGTDCNGIRVPNGDQFIARGVTCIAMTRDAPASRCRFGPREQVNTLTSFVDASMVYGADAVTAARERDLDSDLGLMKETRNPNGDNFRSLLPVIDDPNCEPDNPEDRCFSSGDPRVNENPSLMSFQTLLVREHNRIARRLKELRPCFTGEEIYQIARKIVGAELQHITYSEYLPHLLNLDTRQENNLILESGGHRFTGYDESVNPNVLNAFAGAAYRFGHSMIQNNLNRFGVSPQNREFDTIELKEHFGNPTPVYDVCNGGVDAIFRGLVRDPAQTVDSHISDAVQNNLVREAGDLADLNALNIQRGREHGLPGYNAFREACGLDTFDTFADFAEALPAEVVTAIENLYKDPDDVDLWVGGISEKKVDPAEDVLGPTFQCILGKQFGALRVGDRFWYETDDPVTGFTDGQLAEIRKVSLAGVICINSDSIRQIRKEALHVTSDFVACADIPQMDLRKWTDGISDGDAVEH